MTAARQFLMLGVVVLASAGLAFGQAAISAKAGMVHVAEGDVYLNDQLIQPKATEFPDVKVGQVLRTQEGRAEVLLTPGSFLRLGENSSFRMDSNKLTDVRLEALTGSLLIEVVEFLDENSIIIQLKDAAVTVRKAGVYRLDTDPARVRVIEGELAVNVNGQLEILKESKGIVASAAGWTKEKFDTKETDALLRWAKRRSSYIAMANVSAARQASTGAYGFSRSGWYFNPYFGTFTFLPFYNTMRSPFGYYYYTPYTVMEVYAPPRRSDSVWAGGGGGGYGGNAPVFSTGGLPSRGVNSGYSGSSAPSMGAGSSSPAPSAPAAPRGGESAGGRGGAGGGRGQ
jgi:hypothetical protein